MFASFTEEARKTIVTAKEEMSELKHPYVGSEHLLLAILKNKNEVSNRLKKHNLTYDIFKKELIKIVGVGTKKNDWFLYTPLLKRILENAMVNGRERNQEINIAHLFSSLLEEGEGVAIRLIIGLNINIEKLYKEFFNDTLLEQPKSLLLNKLGLDLTKKASEKAFDPVIGREEEIKKIIEILCRRIKNNPLLIGEAGVGKTAIIEQLAHLISIGQVPPILKNKRIISLDMATTVAGTKYRGEFEERIQKIIKEIENTKDIILFIDEIHTLVGAGGAEGAIDASNILKPALSRGQIKCIGATTTAEYKKYIEKDRALERRFQKIEIEEPTNEELTKILTGLKKIYEKHHKVKISSEIIKCIVNLSNKYLYDRKQPDKAIDVLDEVCSKVNLKETKEMKEYKVLTKKFNEILKKKNDSIVNKDFELASKYKKKENYYMNKVNKLEMSLYKERERPVLKKDVAEVIYNRTKIPVYELLDQQTEMIKRINSNLRKNILGQECAIKEIVNITKKIKLGLKDGCYSLLFCGPSGVGKTELSKIFGRCLVGENNVIKLDMSEYSESHSSSKILGSPPGYIGYGDNSNVLEEIRSKPNSVLIVDEIEKAHPKVINLFYQILDDNKIKDSMGREIRFDSCLIIMTTNIGFESNEIGFFNSSKKVNNELREKFSSSFINRIDNVVVFNRLTKEIVVEIIKNKIKILQKKHKIYEFKIDEEGINKILDQCEYEEYGARKVEQIIKNKMEHEIIHSLS